MRDQPVVELHVVVYVLVHVRLSVMDAQDVLIRVLVVEHVHVHVKLTVVRAVEHAPQTVMDVLARVRDVPNPVKEDAIHHAPMNVIVVASQDVLENVQVDVSVVLGMRWQL